MKNQNGEPVSVYCNDCGEILRSETVEKNVALHYASECTARKKGKRGGARPGAGRRPDCAADGAKKKINAAIPAEVFAKIEGLAKSKRRSVSWVVCELLTLAVDEMSKKPVDLWDQEGFEEYANAVNVLGSPTARQITPDDELARYQRILDKWHTPYTKPT